MASSQAGDGERGRQTNLDWEERERANSPTNMVIRGAVGEKVPRDIVLPAEAYKQMSTYAAAYSMPDRKSDNSTGREVSIGVNMHQVAPFKDTWVHQYDITFTGGPGVEKRGVIRALWESKSRIAELGTAWIWNGDKIAWSTTGIAALNKSKVPVTNQRHHFEVDLDIERGEALKKADDARVPFGEDNRHLRFNKFTLQVRYSKSINLAIVTQYLAGGPKQSWDDGVTEAVTFLSHVLRETPVKNMNAFKNSFYPKNQPVSKRYDLGGAIYALKGVFQSFRMGRAEASKGSLLLNVDVSHACFYHPLRVDAVACQLLNVARREEVQMLVAKSQKDPRGPYRDGPGMKKLQQYLRKLSFSVDYPGISEKVKNKRFIIKNISYESADSRSFEFRNKQTQETSQITVRQYFMKVYNLRLEAPMLPLIEATKKNTYYPMELCKLHDGQRYPFKLDERQTADMIKFAVSRPPVRKEGINEGIKHLDWANDPVLKHFGIKINPAPMQTKARILNPPKVFMGEGKSEAPMYAGRWRIDGKKFFKPNSKPLRHWSVCIISSSRGRDQVSPQEAEAFIQQLMKLYRGHGGSIQNAAPIKLTGSDQDVAKAVDDSMAAMRKAGLPEKQYPDLMLFILPRKNTEMYQRLKRCADLKWGSLTQCVQAAHVKRNQAQYISNVLMKINSKLGGQTFRAMPSNANPKTHSWFKRPTMIIGADVSHPSPGSLGSSQAALTVSMDRDAARYGAAVQSNGFRLEMITTWNWQDMLGPMAREWISNVGGGTFPQHIYYFRDGVSEGQYEHVIQQEVRDIYNVFKALDQSPDGKLIKNLKFTVIVASKRHHIRFFPKDQTVGDKNFNALPGTLVEKDITSFKSFDFYLCSHVAIQGTARPTHYTVIMDQADVAANELQNMIYEHCYQYARSSTPVSLFPAVYYAHLASRRAVAHERQGGIFQGHKSTEQKERYMLMRARAEADITGKIMTEAALAKLKHYTTQEYPPNIPTCNALLWHGMWYI